MQIVILAGQELPRIAAPRIRGVTFILQELRYPGGLIERYCINFAEIVLNKEGPNFRGKGTDGAIALLTNNRTL